jgi:hypothetical protein
MTFTTASTGATNTVRLGSFERPFAVEIPASSVFAAGTVAIAFNMGETSGSEITLYTTSAALYKASVNTAASRVVLSPDSFTPAAYLKLVAIDSSDSAVTQTETTITCTVVTRDYRS